MNNRLKKIISFSVISIFVLVGSFAIAEKNEPAQPNLPVKEIQRFANAVQQIKNYYVKPVSDQEIFDNAIKGMLSSLDPHSNYLNSQDFEELNSSTKGEFSGIGLEVTIEDDVIKVVTAIDDSPAAKAGIKTGDMILAIDGTPTRGLSLREAVNKMRGEKGSHVKLVVYRKGQEKPLTFDVARDVVIVKSVKAKMLEKDYGYIRIASFQSQTAEDLNKAVADLTKQSNGRLKGLILDLRNNPGGLLNSAVEISDAFLDVTPQQNNKLIVFTKGRAQGTNYQAKITPGDITNGVPMVVLINEGSASASEIVAGALQDQKRALIVGQKSFGKGSVQTVMPLDANTAIKLTTALYFTPSGRSIQAEGIQPDILIKDVDLSQVKEKEDPFSNLKEANLSHHLNNPKAKNINNQDTSDQHVTKNQYVNEKDLAFTDFQLYEALNVLKGMTVAHSHLNTSIESHSVATK